MISKPTLCYNSDAGEGHIGNLENFRQEDRVIRMDLLVDWIYELEEEYKKTMKEALNEA